ncbi:MAG: hypothetical protein J6O49_04475 [Bacteroidaceae bacterium]|nr:hypothetical protein [Bacteroidaceae bacterium]
MKKLLYIIIGVAFLMACSERREYVDMLERAKAVLNDRPDSALAVLDSLGQHEADFGKGFRMRYRLHRLNALNKVDTLFRSADEARELADYFDDHGTPNEQMLAYYLLGRAYYDIHEAPMALSCFQTASEKADTTAADCDFRQLSRVYGQMSKVFYQQGLYEQELECEDMSIKYGWKGKDSLNALRSMGGKISAYRLMNNPDSAIFMCEKVSALLNQYGYKDYSAAYLSSVLQELLDKGEIETVERYIRIYEAESGYFDSNNNIEKAVRLIIIIRAYTIWQWINMTLQNIYSEKSYGKVKTSITKMQVHEAWHSCFKRHISQTPLPNMLSIVMR